MMTKHFRDSAHIVQEDAGEYGVRTTIGRSSSAKR